MALPFSGNGVMAYANVTSTIKPSPGNGFLRRLPATRGVGDEMTHRHISSSRAHSDKIPTAYAYVFGVKLSSGGTSGFVGRRCVLEIQDSSQITRSINNFVAFTDAMSF